MNVDSFIASSHSSRYSTQIAAPLLLVLLLLLSCFRLPRCYCAALLVVVLLQTHTAAVTGALAAAVLLSLLLWGLGITKRSVLLIYRFGVYFHGSITEC